MEITINYYEQAVSVSVEVYEYLTQSDHKAENLAHEQRRHWDGRKFDEYIISTEGRLPYCATPEELVCQRETLDEILAVLALCTATQRERFCSTPCMISAMRRLPRCAVALRFPFARASWAFAKSFSKSFGKHLVGRPPKWLPGEGR